MKLLTDYSSATYHDLLDFAVVDKAGEAVGALFSSWSDQKTGNFEFIGVKTGWLLGKNHIIPAKDAQVDEEKKTIQLPYTAELLKEAPACDAAAEITEEHEKEIRDFYTGKS